MPITVYANLFRHAAPRPRLVSTENKSAASVVVVWQRTSSAWCRSQNRLLQRGEKRRDKTEMPGGDPWVLPTTLYDEIGNNERRGRGNWDQKFGSSWVQQPPDQNMSFMSLFADMPDHVIRQQKEQMSRQTRADFGIAPPPPPQPPTLPLPRTARRVISATGKVGYTTRSAPSHRSSRRSGR